MSAKATVQTQPVVKTAITPVAIGMLQRACACGQHAGSSGGECEECKKRERTLQRAAVNNSLTHEVPPIVHEVLRSPGQPLDAHTRAFMEPRFGHDFSRVSLRASGPTILPTALSIDHPDTPFEHEADQAAKRILSIRTSPAAESQDSYDFSQVRIHTDAKAAQSAHSLNALAYTVGNHIVFANGQPSLSSGSQQLLAHELTHVVQQANTHNPGSKSMIQRFTAFSAADQASGTSLGWTHPASNDLRVSDDGQMAVEDNGWGAGLSQRAWTTPSLIADANTTLANQGSHAKLITKGGGTDLSGRAPETGNSMTLKEIEPAKAAGAGVFDLISDCGDACRQIMGSGPAGGKDVAVIKKEPSGTLGGVLGAIGGGLLGGILGAGLGFLAGGPIGAIMGGILGVIGGAIGGGFAGAAIERAVTKPGEEHLTARTYHGGDPTTPEEWSEELFKKEFGAGLSRSEAYAKYAALSPAEKDAFDRKYGINKYAVPRVGQGLTVSTEKDMPGFAPASGFTWNFHYAAAVLASGHDYVTLESAYGWGATDWIFFMYGPETKGQTFHEFHGATDTHGTHWSTFVVQPETP